MMAEVPEPSIETFRGQFAQDFFRVSTKLKVGLYAKGLDEAILVRTVCDDQATIVTHRAHMQAFIYTISAALPDHGVVIVEVLINPGTGQRPIAWGVMVGQRAI